jgi:pimeloyl-ACP methyl ester carboxylesterase
MITALTLRIPGAQLVYDIHGPAPTRGGTPPLLMVGQPMDASGFRALASHFPDRTVVTYDPRGIGRSNRSDGRVDHDPLVQAEDLHELIEALDAGPVDMFASSGGAVTALALVVAHPRDVRLLVAHEPPILGMLPDREFAERAMDQVVAAYQAGGMGAGMAAFIALTSWPGELTGEYFDRPVPEPGQYGLPDEDSGARDDPLLSGRSAAVTAYLPDVAALAASPTRIVIAVGEESRGLLAARCAAVIAERLEQHPSVFPSHHGGFVGGDSPFAGQPEAFAHRLREVLSAIGGTGRAPDES